MRVLLFTAAILVVWAQASAEDLGYRYVRGTCLNLQGQPGYNPGFIGECGDLGDINMNGTVVEASDLSGSRFDKTKLAEASFFQKKLVGVDFKEATLIGTVFNLGDLTRAQIRDSNMQKASLYWVAMNEAVLVGVDLRDADLRGASLHRAMIWETLFTGAVFDEYTWLPFTRQEAEARGMIYTPSDLERR